MTRDPVQAIADAVLYEGYNLYPYRPSAIKNRERWSFGGVFPKSFSEAAGSDPWRLSADLLVEGGARAEISVQLRFLQIVSRSVADESGHEVAFLDCGEVTYSAWQEAIPRDVFLPPTGLARLMGAPAVQEFSCAALDTREVIATASGMRAGELHRVARELRGRLSLSAGLIGRGLYRISVSVENLTPCEASERSEAQLASLASTHAILRAADGDFISLIDPAAEHAQAVRACKNQGWWGVLAGASGARDVMLVSPIILYDHPVIAPESPGDLFDGTEIDEILTLRILAMTDAEKREAASTDALTRKLLERTHALTEADFGRLHGALRTPQLAADRDLGVAVGDRVRLKPKPGGDVMDLVLDGKIAVIEAIERDFEDRVHVAVTIEDDPGRDLGLERFPGHRFFFSRDEMERVP